jgi:hypothetical protein
VITTFLFMTSMWVVCNIDRVEAAVGVASEQFATDPARHRPLAVAVVCRGVDAVDLRFFFATTCARAPVVLLGAER